MLLIKDVPLVPLQKALFKLISGGQDKKVYGKVPASPVFPYITIGAITAKPITVKNAIIWHCSVNLDAWGQNGDRENVNEILSDMSFLITAKGTQMSVNNYKIISTEIELVEAFEAADGGFHGTLTAAFNMQKIN